VTTFVYRSSDTGGPGTTALTTAGAITSILDAILIDGYNSVSGVTVTRSGTTATFTKTAHGFGTVGGNTAQLAGVIVTVAGFTQTEYNVTGPIFNVTANTWDMTVSGSPATPGTTAGTTTAKRAPMKWSGNAWTTSYTASNKRVYRQPTGTNGFYLYIDNNQTRSAAQADVLGFEAATGMGTGTGQFPHALALSANNIKSTLYLATTGGNKWIAIGNGRLFYLLLYSQGANSLPTCLAFGDFRSVRSGDAFNTLLAAATTDTNTGDLMWSHGGLATGTGTAGHTLARQWHQQGSAQSFAKCIDGPSSSTGGVPNVIPIPNPADNALYFYPLLVIENGVTGVTGSYVVIRGSLPMWGWMHGSTAANYGDVYAGAGGLAGRLFECVAINTGASYPAFIETTDTWDT
jgi:hypothetical protein